MFTTFNAYGSTKKEVGKTNKPIWLGDVAPARVGGVLASDYLIAGAKYAAATPINFENGVIKPLVAFKVVSYSAAGAEDTYDTIVVLPAVFGDVNIIPAAEDMLQKLGATFATTAKAGEVHSVTAGTGDDAGKYTIEVAKSANLGVLTAGDYLVYSASATAGSSKAMANQPNAYLYNDISLGDLDSPQATGAAVQFHGDGLLIDFTPAYEFADAMLAAVPNVIQTKFPSGAFVTID